MEKVVTIRSAVARNSPISTNRSSASKNWSCPSPPQSRIRYTDRISVNMHSETPSMTVLKLHDDGWLKLPASLQRGLGAAAGDLLEVVAAEGGLVLRRKDAAPVAAETVAALPPSPPAAAPVVPPAPASLPPAAVPAPHQRGRSRKAVAESPTAKASPSVSVALPPTLRAAGRRRPRIVQPPA
jgi:bifunctional DNA-binding transcriptional regulator/antitoxin component of YhaV-PrlF toxin-antitoxin module